LYSIGDNPDAFREFFLRYGMDMFSVTEPNSVEGIYNFYIHNLPQLYEVHEMFEDEESKAAFRAYIKGRISNRVKDFKYAPEPQYFLSGFLPSQGDIAIDGGAYDGGTAKDFTLQGAKVYSFEMNAQNYKNCVEVAEKYNFVIENLGLSDKVSETFYTEWGAGSRKVENFNTGLTAKFTDLDSYVENKKLPRVDYIKLDIEGAELDMLRGAFKTVSRWKPKMAVSAYHKLEDLWTLANYIKSIRSDYKFKFRHYRIDCKDYILNDEQRKILDNFGISYFISNNCEGVLYCH